MAEAASLEIVTSIGSTNAELLARIERGEQLHEGAWLVADRQSAGRGRLGREWRDGKGNFMGSTVIVLHDGDPAPHTLALVAGIAVYDSLAPVLADARRLRLKWPNDLLLDGAKLAGILLERSGAAVVAGIGINLAQAPDLPGRRTICLAEAGVHVTRDALAVELAGRLAELVALWRQQGLGAIIGRWLARGPAVGEILTVTLPDKGTVEGSYRGLAPDGALLLRLADGEERAIYAGEIALPASEEEG